MTRVATAAAYAILGSTLAWSRLAGLGAGYCCDEIRTVTEFIREGPREILAGPYIPNNHELFSLLGWATSSVIGESEIALRLWSVIPFILGVAVVTTWLHVRIGAVSGLLFLFLATFSPLLLDISRMARGYGLAFLAMSIMIVSALEAVRSGRTWAIAAFWAAGLVGSWTLPHFTVAFVTTGAVLFLRPDLRARCLVGGGLSILAVAIWYAPHFDDIATSSAQEYGAPIPTAWLATAPFDQILLPALASLDDTQVNPSLGTLIAAAAFAVLVGSSPMLRQRQSALILCAGVVTTVLVFWITGTNVVPRFWSFLLVPLFILVATGSAAIVSRLFTSPARVRTLVVVATFAVVASLSVPALVDALRLPRDSTSKAAATINDLVPRSTPVFAHVAYPNDLEFHLGRKVGWSWTPAEAREVCNSDRVAVYVDQPYLVSEATVSCTQRDGARHYRFEQYARGQEIDVWIIPPAAS